MKSPCRVKPGTSVPRTLEKCTICLSSLDPLRLVTASLEVGRFATGLKKSLMLLRFIGGNQVTAFGETKPGQEGYNIGYG